MFDQRMHSDRRRVHDRIERFAWQLNPANGLAFDDLRQQFRALMPPGGDANRRSRLREGQCDSACSPTRTHDQHPAASKLHSRLERTQHTDVICIVSVELSVATDQYGVYGFDPFPPWIAVVEGRRGDV